MKLKYAIALDKEGNATIDLLGEQSVSLSKSEAERFAFLLTTPVRDDPSLEANLLGCVIPGGITACPGDDTNTGQLG